MITKKMIIEKKESKFKLTNNQQILLFTIGDTHYKIDDFPKHDFLRSIKWAYENGAYFIGIGDYLDFAASSQRALMGALRESAKLQIDDMTKKLADEFIELISFTKDRWIGMIEGNHRWDFTNSCSVDQYICKQLNCDFLGTMALIKLVYKNISPNNASCTICVHHGIGSSRTIGGHMHRVEDLLKWIDADIYIMGHSHAKYAATIDMQAITPDGIHYHKTKMMIRSGSWLRGYASSNPLSLDEPAIKSRGSYIEQKAYMPTSLGGVCIGIGYEKIDNSQYYKNSLHYSC